jgi:8-oxo-dGTP diphosphatase
LEGPLVGVGVFVKRNGRILVGMRKGAPGTNTWALPGGRLEPGETPVHCAAREVREETGLELVGLRPLIFTSTVLHQPDVHYVTLFYSAECRKGEPRVLEPDKCEGWRWADPEAIPEPVFEPLSLAFEQIRRLSITL